MSVSIKLTGNKREPKAGQGTSKSNSRRDVRVGYWIFLLNTGIFGGLKEVDVYF
jgi:hypothetical protein